MTCARHAVLIVALLGLFAPACRAEPRHESRKPGAAAKAGNPKIVFEQTLYDFGTVDKGTKVEHHFLFRNAGDATLIVNNVRSSCGCTSVLLTSKEIPPGEAGSIKASFDSKGYQGNVEKTITVESNDPSSPSVRLSLRGTVVSDITVTPQAINFGSLTKGRPVPPALLTISLREGARFKVTGVAADSDRVVMKKIKDTKREFVYEVALAEKLPVGRVFGQITVTTDNEASRDIVVPYHAVVQGAVRADPQVVILGQVTPGTKVVRTVHLRSDDAVELAVTKTETTTPRLTAETAKVGDGTSYDMTLTFDPGDMKEGTIAERVTVVVKGREEEVLTVPVYGTMAAPGPSERR
jgi:cytoskeletal protein CcmA (bactofilin family)